MSATITRRYLEHCKTPCDINEHLPTLARYARECTHVTECGVRTAVSSYAFASGLMETPGTTIVQVDPDYHPNISEFQTIATEAGIRSVYHRQSDLVCPIEETDLLFIDTWHVYGQLKRELDRWHPYVRKYIILHDTTVDEWQGETIREKQNAETQSRASGIPVQEILLGLWPAVTGFLVDHRDWKIRERFTHNNGLTILERISSQSEIA